MPSHKALKKAALDAINDLNGDTSIPVSETREDLEELRNEIDVMLDALPREE